MLQTKCLGIRVRYPRVSQLKSLCCCYQWRSERVSSTVVKSETLHLQENVFESCIKRSIFKALQNVEVEMQTSSRMYATPRTQARSKDEKMSRWITWSGCHEHNRQTAAIMTRVQAGTAVPAAAVPADSLRLSASAAKTLFEELPASLDNFSPMPLADLMFFEQAMRSATSSFFAPSKPRSEPLNQFYVFNLSLIPPRYKLDGPCASRASFWNIFRVLVHNKPRNEQMHGRIPLA